MFGAIALTAATTAIVAFTAGVILGRKVLSEADAVRIHISGEVEDLKKDILDALEKATGRTL